MTVWKRVLVKWYLVLFGFDVLNRVSYQTIINVLSYQNALLSKLSKRPVIKVIKTPCYQSYQNALSDRGQKVTGVFSCRRLKGELCVIGLSAAVV